MRLIQMLLALCIFIAMLMACTTGKAFAQTDGTDSIEQETSLPPTEGPKPEGTKPADTSPNTTPAITNTPTPTETAPLFDLQEEPSSSSELFTFEGPITRWISDFAARTGLDKVSFLGLSGEDWLNLAASVLLFFLIFISGRWFISQGLKTILIRTSLAAVEEFIDVIKSQISWLMVTIALQIGLARLAFLGSGLRILLKQAFFVAYLTIIAIFLWKTIGYSTQTFLRRGRTEEEVLQLQPIYMVVMRIAEALLLVSYASIMLSYFGIDITAFAAALGIGGLAISLAAQDTLADAIAGFLILLDQPFRVGDRIEISGLGTWGDVVEIGTRSTRIRTRDNRLVIVPNSAIAKDQIVNYTYPDPRYRVQIEVGIDYDSDLKLARETAIDAVRHVEGVLADKPVDALFVDFGDSTIIFRIRWWIDSYIDTRRMFDKVNDALLQGFKEANINLPNMTYDLNLKVDEQNVKDFSEAVHRDRPED